MASLKRLIEDAHHYTDEGEKVLAAVKGAYETQVLGQDSVRTGALIATDRRVIFYARRLFGYDFEVFPYSNISSIEGGKGLMGAHVTLFASGNKARMKWIKEGEHSKLLHEVRSRIGKKEAALTAATATAPTAATVAPKEDVPDQIRKLAGLRDAGILTQEEFSAKKTELLSRL